MDLTLFIIAQAIGLVSLVVYCISLQARTRKTLITLIIVVNILNSAIYLLLGSYTGAILSILGIIKLSIYQLYDNKKKNCPVWIMLIFVLAIIVNGVFTYTGWYDVIAVVESVAVTYTTWQKNMTITRLGYFISGVLLVLFNLCVSAYTSALSEAVGLIFSVIGIVRLDIVPKIRRKKTSKMLKELVSKKPIVYNVTLLDLQKQLEKGKYYSYGRYTTKPRITDNVEQFDKNKIKNLVKSGDAIKQNAYTLLDAVTTQSAPIVLTKEKPIENNDTQSGNSNNIQSGNNNDKK